VPAHEAVFTGDPVWDERAFQNARVPCIGPLKRWHHPYELTGGRCGASLPLARDLLKPTTAACWRRQAINDPGTDQATASRSSE